MHPTGFGLGNMPALSQFDSKESNPPPAKKLRLHQVERNVADNNSLPSMNSLPVINSLPPSCNHCLGDVKTVLDHSMVLLSARNTVVVPGKDYSSLIKSLSSFKEMIDSELGRFTRGAGDPALNGQAAMYSPDSPVSERAMTPISPGSEFSPRCKRSTEGVVHGTGVIATQNFKVNEEICPYDGPLVYRILNHHSGKYHVFTMKSTGNDGFTGLDFPENDTYVAWSGVVIAKAGRPAIELGRNCEHDIRFLNHSKQANVMICYTGMDSVAWGDRDSLRLTVVALRDIKSGEELLFDYDKNKPDSEIDFSISALEQVTEEQRNKIIKRVNVLNQKHLHIGKKISAKTQEKEVELPQELDDEIGEIMEKINDFRSGSGHPANIYQLKKVLTSNQKKLLNIIFSDNALILEDLASYLSSVKTVETENTFMDKLTAENIKDLKDYLERSIFNQSQTWVDIEELKEHFASFK
ncbi:SET domain-containing protein [Endozoicomonas sp. YOMI1]|uniref:SET domain-containing protein n=1 Tax=Endozoicomonas sp. YOMI1 TaxID=2828739 RepID=UPI002147790F|nr:SET domain-containing protein [Endozoicomonas sp. YOMI1]